MAKKTTERTFEDGYIKALHDFKSSLINYKYMTMADPPMWEVEEIAKELEENLKGRDK